MYYDNRKLALSIFWLVLGLVLVILSVMGVIDDSVYSGMGAALMVVGGLQIWRNLKYRRDPEFREKIDIQAGDERITSLRLRSWAWTGYATVMAAAVGSLIAMWAGQPVVQQTLLYVVCFVLVVYWVSYLILNKKY